jgi:hypothetical protein
MDQDRQIRFAIPPFFLLASLLWGAYLGGVDLSPLLKPDTAKGVLGLLAAAAVAVVPLGFLISSASIFIMRCLAGILRKPTYEACLTDAAYGEIWTWTESPLPKDAKKTLYAVATFDHEFLAPGIHTWLMRRWNAFNVAAHSALALFAAHAMAPYFHVPQTWRWWRWTAVLVVLLVYAAITAWRETMAMLEFQTTRFGAAGRTAARANGDFAGTVGGLSTICRTDCEPHLRLGRPKRPRVEEA